jgi:cytochrome c-type biogenesis protein CcmF
VTIVLGNYSLCAAVVVAMVTVLVSLAAVLSESTAIRRAARWCIYLMAMLLTISSAALMKAMLDSDFRLKYVAEYTERALPIGYKLAAFWAGQQGSLLLWGWLLAVMSAVFAFQHRKRQGPEHDVALATLAVVIGFFAALMVFADPANPFLPNPQAVADGHGLNPMLQDPGMIAHPPTLFVGYAGFTIPFALLIGALITGRLGSDWVAWSRPWALISWLFLGVGIVLGAQWAYVELGWGGYWAWDPVENASLLPWLTATALLHSIVGQRQRGVLKRWTAVLTAGTFILCIFGTYITRSGVVASVHSFGKSPVGTFFQVFLILTVLLSLILMLCRWRAMRSERPLESAISRESAFLAGNVLFVLMMLLTLFGTMFPAISPTLSNLPLLRNLFMVPGQSMTLEQPFYNSYVLPPALLAVAIMGFAPLLGYGRMAINSQKLVLGLALPVVLAFVAIGVLLAMGVYSAWALACAVVGAVVVGSIVVDLVRNTRTRQQNTGENAIRSALKLVLGSHQRYGAQLAHAGMMMIVAGVAGSSLYNTSKTLMLKPGASEQVGRYTIRLDGIGQVRGENYTGLEAKVTMTAPSGTQYKLFPQGRMYNKWEQPNSEVAIQTNWREDLYVTFAGAEPDFSVVALKVLVNPLVWWIWVGGIVVTLGGVICLVPRFARRAVVIETPQPVLAAKAVGVQRVAAGTAR